MVHGIIITEGMCGKGIIEVEALEETMLVEKLGKKLYELKEHGPTDNGSEVVVYGVGIFKPIVEVSEHGITETIVLFEKYQSDRWGNIPTKENRKKELKEKIKGFEVDVNGFKSTIEDIDKAQILLKSAGFEDNDIYKNLTAKKNKLSCYIQMNRNYIDNILQCFDDLEPIVNDITEGLSEEVEWGDGEVKGYDAELGVTFKVCRAKVSVEE